eukprot:Clim_evm23s197 gene=Clim_evmTU23s197
MLSNVLLTVVLPALRIRHQSNNPKAMQHAIKYVLWLNLTHALVLAGYLLFDFAMSTWGIVYMVMILNCLMPFKLCARLFDLFTEDALDIADQIFEVSLSAPIKLFNRIIDLSGITLLPSWLMGLFNVTKSTRPTKIINVPIKKEPTYTSLENPRQQQQQPNKEQMQGDIRSVVKEEPPCVESFERADSSDSGVCVSKLDSEVRTNVHPHSEQSTKLSEKTLNSKQSLPTDEDLLCTPVNKRSSREIHEPHTMPDKMFEDSIRQAREKRASLRSASRAKKTRDVGHSDVIDASLPDPAGHRRGYALRSRSKTSIA